jgi:hypothetical protein
MQECPITGRHVVIIITSCLLDQLGLEAFCDFRRLTTNKVRSQINFNRWHN